MDRKEFFKTTVKGGACACAMMFLGGGDLTADDKKQAEQREKEKQKEKGEREFITNWTETLMLIMDKNLDEKTRTNIMEAGGRKCAERTFKPTALKFKGNTEGFLDTLKQMWAETVSYDKAKGTITLHMKKFERCFCPLAAGKKTFKTGTFCLCSQGWMKEVFETVTEKKVKAEMLSTILTGSDHCSVKITIV